MLVLSLLMNVAVLVPVLAGLWRGAAWADAAYGPDTAARRILATLYFAILLVSLAALALVPLGPTGAAVALAWPMLVLQVLYKLATWPAVGLSNPVVRANLAIAAVHTATLVTLWI